MTQNYLFIMKILKVDLFNPDPAVLRAAVEVLQSGGVIAHPTDTCYGFAADVLNRSAIERLYALKRMDFSKPVSMMVNDISQVEEFGVVTDLARDLMRRYWPGALTLVISRSRKLPVFFNAGAWTIGFRMPDCRVSRGLIKMFGGVLTTTSANISKMPAPYSVAEILEQFENQALKPDLILDGGVLENRPASTVVDVSGKEARILRSGAILLE